VTLRAFTLATPDGRFEELPVTIVEDRKRLTVNVLRPQFEQLLTVRAGTRIYGSLRPQFGQCSILSIGSPVGQLIGAVGFPRSQRGPEPRIFLQVDGSDVRCWQRCGQQLEEATLMVIEPAELIKRTPFDPTCMEKLRASVVALFGGGSGGGTIAGHLARAGVGELRIIDPDRLEAPNLSRHECGFGSLGLAKPEALEDYLRGLNPQVRVRCWNENVLDGTRDDVLEEVLDGVDLVVGAMDHLPASLYLNREAWLRGIPGVWGGCYEEARGGEVLFTLPDENTPCLECLRSAVPSQERERTYDYSKTRDGQTYEGEPGLFSAVSLITIIEVQFILAMLLRGTSSQLTTLIDPRRNYLLIGGALAEGFYRFDQPFQIFFQPLSGPRKDCDTHRLGVKRRWVCACCAPQEKG
jgi:molybdopterin/thiamine biosynthesis adenylyltransferase